MRKYLLFTLSIVLVIHTIVLSGCGIIRMLPTENVFDEIFYDVVEYDSSALYNLKAKVEKDFDFRNPWPKDDEDGHYQRFFYETTMSAKENNVRSTFQIMELPGCSYECFTFTVYTDAKYIEFAHSFYWEGNASILCIYTYRFETKSIEYRVEKNRLNVDINMLPQDDFLYNVFLADWIESTGSNKEVVYPETEE